MNILQFLIQGIPETMGVIALSLSFARVPLRWSIILLIGVLLTTVIYFIRSLEIQFGLHTLASLMLLFIILNKTTNVPVSKCLIYIFASYVTLALLELVIHEPFFTITKLDPKEVMSNTIIWTSLGLVQALVLNLLAHLVSIKRKPVTGVWKI